MDEISMAALGVALSIREASAEQRAVVYLAVRDALAASDA